MDDLGYNGAVQNGYERYLLLIAVMMSAFLLGCATTTPPPNFTSGGPKNSLAFMEATRIEEVHVVAIPPFANDRPGWKEPTQEIVASSPGIALVDSGKLSQALKGLTDNIETVPVEKRLALLGSLGRTVGADAVLHGALLGSGNSQEIILQLISSRDSRLLWWQAVEVTFRDAPPTRSEQKALMLDMLRPLLSRMAKRERPALPTALPEQKIKVQPKESEPKGEPQPKAEQPKPAPKTKKGKGDKGTKPAPKEISPM